MKLEVKETEEELIFEAQQAVSQCNWKVGECAAKWTKRYSKGRTDADFGKLVGLSSDQIYQRRRVFETYGKVRENYSSVRWSHFYLALNWEDADECLQWSEENEATVAEMRAYRRALHGEDLSLEATSDTEQQMLMRILPEESTEVRDIATDESTMADGQKETVANGAEYAPFRKGAGSPLATEASPETTVAVQAKPDTAKLFKRMTATIEKFHQELTPEVMDEFRGLEKKMQNRFQRAVASFSSKAASML